ncbi:MAG TPA: hypothetical protein VJV39_11870 [Dongiaceae bacterium]|nr:hypothetical protein [Dongiaceae bacterium]
MMKRNPAFLALLAVLAATVACTPTSKVAEPDIVMKSPVAPNVLTQCLAIKLGQNFRDQRPIVDTYAGIHEITIESPRGEKLAFVEVQSDYAGGSTVRFWDGDLYWPDHRVSGVWPDVMRDNWHRFEAAERDCQPTASAARTPAKGQVAPPPPAVPVQSVIKSAPLKPIAGTTPGAPRDLTP